MERCTLCGGKLVNGKCTECGLDNTKNDKKYKLNTHNEKETRFHRGDCEDHLNQNCDSSKAWGKNGAWSSRSAGRGRAGSAQPKGTMSGAQRAKVLKERSKTGTIKKKSGLSRLIFWIVLLVILFEMFGGSLIYKLSEISSPADGLDSLVNKLLMQNDGEDGSDWPNDGNVEDAAVDEALGEKPSEIIWNEQSSGYFEEGLTMGVYTVGYEIPAGAYQMFCDTGTAWCYLYDAEADSSEYFALYSLERQESYAESFGECDYYELSGEIKLRAGDIIYVEECDEGVFIKGEGDGEDSLQRHEPQNLQETVVVQDGMKAGVDFEPGVYDVILGEIPDDDYGSAYLSITNQEGYDYYISLHQEMPVFYRFPFHEGDSIELASYGAEAEVTLSPSY